MAQAKLSARVSESARALHLKEGALERVRLVRCQNAGGGACPPS